MSRAPVIHRDRTFTYQGETWRVYGGGPGTPNHGWGYFVAREAGGPHVDGFFYMAEVRDWLREHAAHDRPLIEDDDVRGSA